MTDIITTSTLTITTAEFKDKHLAEATAKIRDIYNAAMTYAEEKNREIALILSDVKRTKCYEKDGFTSVGDYAEKVFGIKKMSAYQLSVAGDVYGDQKASPALKAFTPSKVAELARYDREAVEKDIAVGVITPDTTQKDLRKYADEHYAKSADGKKSKSKPANVVPTYTVDTIGLCPTIPYAEFSTPRIMEDWDNLLTTRLGTAIETMDMSKITEGKVKGILRRLYYNDVIAVIVKFYPYVNGKSTAPVKYTEDEYKVMLEERRKMSKEVTNSLYGRAVQSEIDAASETPEEDEEGYADTDSLGELADAILV